MTIDWRRCTDPRCACHSFDNSGPRWTWTLERLIGTCVADAGRSAGQPAGKNVDEQVLWDALADRISREMVATTIHGCPWRIAREVFDALCVAPVLPIRSPVTGLPSMKRPLRGTGFPDGGRPPKAA